jgi:hypothetical protein
MPRKVLFTPIHGASYYQKRLRILHHHEELFAVYVDALATTLHKEQCLTSRQHGVAMEHLALGGWHHNQALKAEGAYTELKAAAVTSRKLLTEQTTRLNKLRTAIRLCTSKVVVLQSEEAYEQVDLDLRLNDSDAMPLDAPEGPEVKLEA